MIGHLDLSMEGGLRLVTWNYLWRESCDWSLGPLSGGRAAIGYLNLSTEEGL